MAAVTILVGLAGGLGLFIFGMQVCSEGLQKMAARRLKRLVRAVTDRPWLALLSGVIITFALQGSNATAALVVGFVSAKIMTLAQALGVLLGSAIGGSLTAQLIAFRVTNLALLLLFVGALLHLFSRRSRQRSLGQAILGFGLLFYGMAVMSQAVAPLGTYPGVAEALVRLERAPLLGFGVGLVGTAVLQSSTAFLALLMTLASEGLLGPYAIVPFVLGAHVGGTVGGVLSSLGAPGREPKRAALANLGFKLVNGLVFLPLYHPLTALVLATSGDVSRQVANAHTLFSLAMAAIFLPFAGRIARFMEWAWPDREAGMTEARFLDESLLSVPELAVDQAHRQTVEMGRILQEEMMSRVLPAVRLGSEEMWDRMAEAEQAMDSLYRQISRYLAGLGDAGLPDPLMERSIQVLYTANDLEHVGDILMNVIQLARKIQQEDLALSPEGMEEVEGLFSQTQQSLRLTLEAFATLDSALASRVIKEHPRILRLEQELRFSHFDRLQSGNAQTMATSAIHLDLMEAFLRIEGHAVNIARAIMGMV
ncbi:MAG: Na/Pi cotransporter family protein [Clostridia bacterium]|nr:Na/Pi cotransporter family protein [Clostridia bacterium]